MAPGIHSKHHEHPLQEAVLSPQLGLVSCHGCRLLCSGSVYSCNLCSCVLHRSCATAPAKIEHPAHKGHVLAFASEPPYLERGFSCDACGEEGSGFSYHCTTCSYDLHVPCAYFPEKVKHRSHEHPLRLLYANPYTHNSFRCNICGRDCVASLWLYHCATCSFDAHLQCANNAPWMPKSTTSIQAITPQQASPGNSYGSVGHVRPNNQMPTIPNEVLLDLLQQLLSAANPQGGGASAQNPLLAGHVAGNNNNPFAMLLRHLINGHGGNGPIGSLVHQFLNGGGGGGGFGQMGPMVQQLLGGGDGGLGLMPQLMGGGDLWGNLLGGGGFGFWGC